MPHIVVEYSDNLVSDVKQADLLALLHKTVIDSGLFNPDAVKARGQSYSDYVLTGDAQNFMHITVSILSGRDTQERAALSSELISVVRGAVADVEKLSVNVHEMNKETYRK